MKKFALMLASALLVLSAASAMAVTVTTSEHPSTMSRDRCNPREIRRDREGRRKD